MGGIDDDFLDPPGSPQLQDRPVMPGLAPPPRLPAITHVHAAPGRSEVLDAAIMLVIGDDAAAAISHRQQVEARPGIDRRPVLVDPAPHAQPRHAAIGEDVQADMRDGVGMLDRHIDAVVAVQREARRDPGPAGIVARDGLRAAAQLDLGTGGIVAGEMTRVDLEAGDDAGNAEADHAPVVAGPALAAALPAVHPLAVLVVFTGDELGLPRRDQAGPVAEDIVRGVDHLRPQPGLGQVDSVPAQIFEHAHPGLKRAARRNPAIR